VTVANEVGCPLPGASVAMSSTKETTPGTSNTWVSAGGTVFTTYTGTTGAGGTLATSVQAPASVGAQAAGNTALGKGTITATCGSATGTAYVTLYRPLGSLTATGPARLDVGVSSTASGAQSYQLTGALDVDGNTATTPSVTWTVSNVAGPASIGNTGDTSAPTAADASINASTGVVAPGSTAGKIQVKVASSTDATVYATITTDIYGPPTKMLFSPDTATPSDGYTAAQGYALPISFTVIDSYGHTVPFTELTSPLATTYSISSSAAGSIAAGATAESFTLTFGNTTGTITIGTGAFTWHGAEGGSATLGAITRTINVVGS
jgi:hypothetical protein